MNLARLCPDEVGMKSAIGDRILGSGISRGADLLFGFGVLPLFRIPSEAVLRSRSRDFPFSLSINIH
jgi:hypothetical protein